MLKNRLIYLTVSTCAHLINVRTLHSKTNVKINSMKCRKLSIVAVSVVLFCSCGQQPAQERGPRPVKLAEVASLNKIEKSYSGVVSPDQFSDLAFKMSGPLVAMNVLEGQRVKKGEVVAEIDPTDYKLDYDAKRASFQKASSQMQRAEKLLMKNAISMQEFETTQASYTNAKSAFENAQNTLNDTKLRAPFDGFIQKKYVENYQRVNSGEGIVQLVNTHNLRIKFTIPDAYLYLLRTKDPRFLVEFDTFKGHVFQAKLEEYLDISTDGTGIPVSITIDDPSFDRDLYAVKPGFTCSIRFTADVGPLVQDSWTIIPLSAVFGESEGKKMYVWVVEDNKVHKREVTVNAPTGEAQVLISKGLKPEEKIVIAGVYQLVEGENVKDIEK